MKTRRPVRISSKPWTGRTRPTNDIRKAQRRVSFTVEPLPEDLQVVNEVCTQSQKAFFDEQILSILREYPYELRDVIQEHLSGDGRPFYTCYDGIVPLVFTYLCFRQRRLDDG